LHELKIFIALNNSVDNMGSSVGNIEAEIHSLPSFSIHVRQQYPVRVVSVILRV